jgi:hypothetical protein
MTAEQVDPFRPLHSTKVECEAGRWGVEASEGVDRVGPGVVPIHSVVRVEADEHGAGVIDGQVLGEVARRPARHHSRWHSGPPTTVVPGNESGTSRTAFIDRLCSSDMGTPHRRTLRVRAEQNFPVTSPTILMNPAGAG